MGRLNIKALAVVIFTLLAGACSIKENRDPCPCALMLDFKDVDTLDVKKVDLLVSSSGGFRWADTVDVARCMNGYSAFVPRTDLHIRAWAGAEEYVAEGCISIPRGKDCPRIYMYVAEIETEGEMCREKVTMYKNHCVMTLVTEGDEGFEHDLVLEGNVAGYGADGMPLQGDFEYLLQDKDLEAGYQAVLPRQTDASLMLRIEDGSSEGKYFALGQYILASGYDWKEKDLMDITVTIDYALTQIRLIINGWESVYTYDMEI